MAAAPATKPDFSGTWELVTTDNLDEFLEKSEGFGWIKRKAASTLSVTIVMEQDMDKDTLKVTITMTGRGSFSLEGACDGTEFTYEDFDKRSITSTFKWSDDGTRLVEEQKRGDELDDITSTRWIDGEEFLMEIHNTVKDVKCLRHFKRKAA